MLPVPDPPPIPLAVREDMGEMFVGLPDNHAAAILASRSGSAPVPNEDVDDACLSSACCCSCRWYFRRIEFGDDDAPSVSPSSKDLFLVERPLLALLLLLAATGDVLATLASHVLNLPREMRFDAGGLLPDPARWGVDGRDDGDEGLSAGIASGDRGEGDMDAS